MRLEPRLTTLLSQDTIWQDVSFRVVFALLLASGAGLSQRGKFSSRALLFLAAIGMLVVPLIWTGLAETLPRLARFLPALESWPRVLVWITLIHALMLAPVAPALGASLARTWRESPQRWLPVPGVAGGILVAFLWLTWGFAGPLDTLQLFPASAAIILLLESLRPPRKAALVLLLLCLTFLAAWPQPQFHASLEKRFGTLLALTDGVEGIALATDDANRGRLLRGPDGRATYAEGMQQEDRFLAHLPLVLHGAPQRILFLGRGSGHAVAAASIHGGLDVSVRDRPAEPPALARWLSGPPDAGLSLVPARHACHPVTTGPFDVIVLQPPPVTSERFATCLSPNFLASVANALSPTGIYAMEIDPGTLPVAELALLIKHLRESFADLTIWAGQPASRWTAVASNHRQSISLEQLRGFWQDPAVGASLRASGRPTPFHLLAEFLMPGTTVDEFAETFAEPGATIPGLPARTARHANSNFGFSSATSDDWTVSILGGETIVPDAFRRIFAQMERSETWRQPPGDLLRPPAPGTLSVHEIDRIIADLRAAGRSPD